MNNVIQFPSRPAGSAADHKRMAGSRDRALAISVIMPRLIEALGPPDRDGIRRAGFTNFTSFTLMPSGRFWLMAEGLTQLSGYFVPKTPMIIAQYRDEGVNIQTWRRGSWQSAIFD